MAGADGGAYGIVKCAVSGVLSESVGEDGGYRTSEGGESVLSAESKVDVGIGAVDGMYGMLKRAVRGVSALVAVRLSSSPSPEPNPFGKGTTGRALTL